MSNLIFRCYIDSNDTSLTKEFISSIFDTLNFSSNYKIGRTDAGWGTKDWCIAIDLGACHIRDFNWEVIGLEIYNSLHERSKINIYLNRENVFNRTSKFYDIWNGIELRATKVDNQINFDFSEEALIEKQSEYYK